LETTADALVAAAQQEIAERGWGGVRTRGVAQRAGVNNALVHYHFGSLDALKLRAVETTIEAVADDTMGAALDASTPAEIVRLVGAGLAAARVESVAWRVLVEALVQAAREPAVAGMMVRLLDSYRTAAIAVLGDAVARGDLPITTDVDALAGAVLALLDGVALHRMLMPGTDLGRIVGAFAALLETSED
jgi:AcrR family transcriptional regulator